MGSSYPNSIDSAATLYSPVDAFSTKSLETTASQQILAGDSTVSVASTDGFAATYGILSVDDELIVYTAKTGTQFTGCQRGAFGTQAAQHALGATVLANMVSGFLTALQSAVLAIENELGTVAARNYVLAAGAQTVTGLKTFVDGVALGSGVKSATGLARLPNTGGIKRRNAANSGDLGMALNASDHLVMDAIIDFAGGQTFGAFSYPDATTTSKGIVQIDPVGGLAVAAGVASLAATGVVAGTYQKVTVDAKGRVTGGTTLVSGDLPAHTHVAGDVSSGAFGVPRGGTGITTYTLGDLLYCSAADTLAKLAGNTTATRKFLRQTGTGSASAAPAWDTLLAGDLPAHTHAESDVTGLVTDLAAKVAGAANLTTQYRMLCTSAAGTATESTTIATDAAGGLNLAKYLSLAEMTPPGTPGAGSVRLYLEDIKGFSFLSFIDDTGMVRKLVRDSVFVAKNVSGSAIGIGKAVYASGSSGNVPTIALAKSDDTSTMPAIGITIESIADGAFGRVMQVGLLEHINTNAFAEGDVVFVSDTAAGDLTTTIPLVPHLRQEIGTVLVKGIGNGTLQIIARSISQEDTGTRLNSWRVGDGTAGAKTVVFNNGADHTLSWNPSGAAKTITLPDLTGTVALGGSNLSTANAVALVSSAGVVTETTDLMISSTDLVAAVTTRVNGPLAIFECGPYQTVGGAFENMLKRSEDFSSATWDRSAGSCTVVADNSTAPDGNATADTAT
ncbi:MAG: hypothetical protein Q8N47_19060, partial [Bryobacterales bacterium]|nr:hypothetical protein [Bryobacterales bacterium]